MRDGETIRIADQAAAFADHCLALLDNRAARQSLSDAARNMVATSASWDAITCRFESLLLAPPLRP